jgi:hypothetical protein
MENPMKRKILVFMLGGLILLGSTLFGGADEPFQNKEMDQFFKGKTAVFAGDWPGVRSGMESYLKDYPAGKMRDEALYWLARSLDRLARDAKDVFSAIDLKRKAAASLDRLVKEFPDSLWRDDAKEMQIAIAAGLVILGVEDQLKFLEDAVRSEGKNAVLIKTAALDSIIALDSKTAIPVLRNFLKTESDAGLRKRAVRLLGQKFSREISAILEDTAKNDGDPEVRKEAGYWIEKIRIRLIPVQVSYYGFETKVTDTSEYAKVPEGKIASFTIPHDRVGSQARAKTALGRFFNGRVEFTGSMAGGSSGILEEFGLMSRTSHRIAGFYVELDAASIAKTASEVTGQVRIGEQSASFKVDGSNDVILAARRGDRQAVIYLEMTAKDVAEVTENRKKSSSTTIGTVDSPDRESVYTTDYNMKGMVVSSTRSSLDSESFKASLFDFGRAKAKIDASDGIWTLTGQLLLLNKEQILVGRAAKLVRPDGTTAAIGDDLRVPVGNPAGFKIGAGMDSRTPGAAAQPESGSEAAYPLENGGWIRSPRPGAAAGDPAGGLLDFGTAQASLPGPRGNWILTGYIVFLKSSKEIVAYKAVLTNPEGKTAVQGELLFVPVKNPDQYRLAVERIK